MFQSFHLFIYLFIYLPCSVKIRRRQYNVSTIIGVVKLGKNINKNKRLKVPFLACLSSIVYRIKKALFRKKAIEIHNYYKHDWSLMI